jgi:hypothetical protein
MVVTAQVFFESSDGDKNGDRVGRKSSQCSSKSFVQTFYLVREGRNFACYNDVLRFLQFPVSKSEESSTETTTTATNTYSTTTAEIGVVTDSEAEEKASEVEQVPMVVDEDKLSVEATPTMMDDEAPGGGVEESKEEAPDDEDKPSKEESTDLQLSDLPTKDGKGKKSKGGSKVQNQRPKQQPASKPAPGSWASLVASGSSAPNTPSRKLSQPDKPELGAEASKASTAAVEKENIQETTTNTAQEDASGGAKSSSGNKSSNKGQSLPEQRPKRDPDMTLVIKNLSDNVKEQDIINMFKPFAVQTNSKIVGTNLNHHRGLAFVDYDEVAPVMAALQKHQETPFQWNGKILEVDQKTLEVRARRQKTGGQYRSASPGNGFRNSGGGRDQYRKGDRGGRRPGRGGRGGR